MADTEFLKVSEVAARLSISRMTVYRLVEDGSIPAIRIGHMFRIKKSDLNRYIRNSVITKT